MKIAVATDCGHVAGHFGHCPGFEIYETDEVNILSVRSVANPGHKPGFLPNYLNDLGVNVIISGGMGGGAIDIFNTKGIEVITGATGDTGRVVEAYLSGGLKSSGSVCHEHAHHGNCGEHA